MQKVAVYRKEHFNAAHRLHNPDFDDATNERVFGKCNNPHFHGHNYELIVKLIGEPDKETGYVMDLKALSNIIKENVLKRFDHKNLNLDVVEFKTLNPTAEKHCYNHIQYFKTINKRTTAIANTFIRN